jgi:two-component system chemotaxis response regulator CheB
MVGSSARRAVSGDIGRGSDRAQYQVMVVDDSAVIRGYITRMLEADPDFRVVTTAANGEIAVKAVARYDIDVVILDIEMPVMDGLTALPLILKANPKVKVLMASTLTRRNATISIKALSAGAADYVPKPDSTRDAHASEDFRRELVSKIKAISRPKLRRATTASGRSSAITLAAPPKISLHSPSTFKPEVLAIGSSTGGPQALFKLFETLKDSVRIPIFITQHMPATFTAILAEHIQRVSGVECAEGRDHERVMPNRIYLAPGEYHMVIDGDSRGPFIRINQDPPENYCRPAVDPMFRSIAKLYGVKVLSVVLTGMGKDGKIGGQAIIDAGGTVIAQDEPTSVVWGMPGAAATAGICSAVLPLDKIAPKISQMLKGVGA